MSLDRCIHLSDDILARLRAREESAYRELIERAGHICNLERPEEFNTLVGAFIRGVDSRS